MLIVTIKSLGETLPTQSVRVDPSTSPKIIAAQQVPTFHLKNSEHFQRSPGKYVSCCVRIGSKNVQFRVLSGR
jgi:hypothetical protein